MKVSGVLMRRASAVGVAFSLVGLSSSAAQAVTTYASVTGNNANACTTASAPCATIGAALAKAEATGFPRVVVLGPGIFNEAVTVTATSGAEIVGDGNGFAAIAPPAGGVGVTVSVGASGMRIGNLQFLGNSGAAASGIKILTASRMDIENVEIHGFATAGIDSEVSTAPYPALTVANSVLADGGCLRARATGGANLSALVENTRLHNCSVGVLVDSTGTTTTGSVQVVVRNSSIENATTAFQVTSGSASGQAMGTLDHSIANNSLNGVIASGAKTYVYLHDATIMNTHTGVTNKAATVISYGDNNIAWNAVDVVGTLSKNPLQ